MEKVLKIYKSLSHTSALAGARFLQDGVINTIWTQRNIETGKTVKFMRTHIFNKESNSYTDTFPLDISQETLVCTSSCGQKRAVLREVSSGKDNRKQFIEIWTNNCLSHSVDLAALNLHGDVYTEGDFRTWVWSPCDTKVLYIAEKNLPKTEPFYKRKLETSESIGDGSTPALGDEYKFRQDWGEQLVKKRFSILAFYDLCEDKVNIIEGIPENLCPGQASWSPDGSSVIGIVLETEPRKFGLVYCTNRSGNIFSLDFNGNYECLSNKNCAVNNPRYSPDGEYIIWFERDVGGPHQGCMRLMKLHIISKSAIPEIVVDIVEKERIIRNNEKFYGIYAPRIPRKCWANDKRRIILSTNQNCSVKTYVIDICTGDITELKYDLGTQRILNVSDDNLLVSIENYFQNNQCFTGTLPPKGNESEIKWTEVTKKLNITYLDNMKFEYLDLEHSNNDEIKNFTAIYLGPKEGNEKTVPLIVCPHGGPHSAYFNTFVFEPTIFVALGFAVLFVNYRGSLGQGEDNLRFLNGKVGTADVQDCYLATKECLKMYPWLDSNRLGLAGGSHGGFLVHHLSGQFPDMFKAVVSRNPVVDIASMSIMSDIPDWSAIEAGSLYTQQGEVNNDLFLKMLKMSPIQYAHKIKAPTYLMLGCKDRRVPIHQGLELLYRLQTNGCTVKASVYDDDNHPLASVPTEMDHIINSALWLLEHVKKD